MFYLRKEEHEMEYKIGDEVKKCIVEDRAIYKHKNLDRFYRNPYPIPEYSDLELYKAKTLKNILELRKRMFEYCGEWFDIYDENGKVDINNFTG
ncbi:MAG TPA: hypothetical protein GX514_06900 [Thermoanaerobacterales bacterium]|nr:hypothetical protein [Thermoanaerobacterales bacterium]